MAIARCKVYVSARTEKPVGWGEPNPAHSEWEQRMRDARAELERVESTEFDWREMPQDQDFASFKQRRVDEARAAITALAKSEPPKSLWKSAVVSPPEPEHPEGRCDRTFEFAGAFPQTGVPEDERFWAATPSFSLTMNVQNAGVDFEVGRPYFLDFVRAPLE